MNTKLRTILLKITGEALPSPNCADADSSLIRSIAKQIQELQQTHRFAVVIGGGNIFRGSSQGKQLGMSETAAHQVGMLATLLNGLMIKDIFEQEGVRTSVLTAIDCPSAGKPISPETIQQAKDERACMVFVGGTGAPFFTTDTAAVVRALSIGADELWKATDVDGIFATDPKVDPQAKFIDRISYGDALERQLGIIDATAVTIAREHKLPIRLFNIFTNNALLCAARDNNFGSLILNNMET